MATYNNQHWLLCHIRNSFISTDDTGMCEAVMLSEDIPNQYAKYHKNALYQDYLLDAENPRPPEDYNCYPGLDESDEEDIDTLSSSYDIQMDPDNGLHRQRSNTAQKLEKMDLARRKAAKIRNVKCDDNTIPLYDPELDKDLFVKKEVPLDTIGMPSRVSTLSQQLRLCPKQPQNKFLEYARFDGISQTGIPTKTYKIFITFLPEKLRNYPLQICVTATAKIEEFIGLICYKCSIVNPDISLQSVKHYGLYMTEENGEMDLDFPPLDVLEPCSKFCFSHLSLAERRTSDTQRTMSMTSEMEDISNAAIADSKASSVQKSEDMKRMIDHTTMMEAPLYRVYRVFIMSKARFKTEIQLGISGEKIEIDPVQPKNSKLWSRQRAVNHNIDSIAWCQLMENKTTRSIFRIVYSLSYGLPGTDYTSSPLKNSASFKHYDFATDSNTAQEIVEKINNILEVRSSASRRIYIESKEKRYRSSQIKSNFQSK